MAGERLKCIAEVNRLFGADARIFPCNFGRGLIVGCDVGFAIIGKGVSVDAGGYPALLKVLAQVEPRRRRAEASSWCAAAFEAAAQGYDVREPCRQLQEWITNGSNEEG